LQQTASTGDQSDGSVQRLDIDLQRVEVSRASAVSLHLPLRWIGVVGSLRVSEGGDEVLLSGLHRSPPGGRLRCLPVWILCLVACVPPVEDPEGP